MQDFFISLSVGALLLAGGLFLGLVFGQANGLLALAVFVGSQVGVFVFRHRLNRAGRSAIGIAVAFLLVPIGFLLWERSIATIAANLLLLLAAILYSIEGLIVAVVIWAKEEVHAVALALLAQLGLLVYTVMRLFSGNVPGGYGP